MARRDRYDEGVPSWVDLATHDVETARSFYSELFGWEYDERPTDTGSYLLAMQSGEPAAGMGSAEGDTPSVWNTYLSVDDVDATVEKIDRAGGRVLMGPLDVIGTGRMAIAADPTGAVFGVWQAGTHIGARIVNEHGTLNWNELTTDDTARAVDFYEQVFGYEVEASETPSGRDYHLLKVSGRPIAGAMAPPAPDIPNSWGTYFAVDDAELAERTAKENGGEVTYGPLDAPGVGTFVGLVDPVGSHFTIIQLAEPVD